jgi:hypothetical protein
MKRAGKLQASFRMHYPQHRLRYGLNIAKTVHDPTVTVVAFDHCIEFVTWPVSRPIQTQAGRVASERCELALIQLTQLTHLQPTLNKTTADISIQSSHACKPVAEHRDLTNLYPSQR